MSQINAEQLFLIVVEDKTRSAIKFLLFAGTRCGVPCGLVM